MPSSLPTNRFYHYIDGCLVPGSGRETAVVCPGNEAPVASLRLADKTQMQDALAAADRAFPAWSALPLEARGEWMMKLSQVISDHSAELLDLLMLESGKLKSHAAFETASLTNYLRFFLEQAKAEHSEGIRDMTGGKGLFLAVREPVGVVGAALAWNFPLHNMATKLGPVLAAGCTAVIKPATKTPLSTLYLGELMAGIGFPAGVINFVAGDAAEIGVALCASPIPRLLTMIGSTQGGLQMIRDSATTVKRFSIELGGNAPVIVAPSADIDAAVAHTIGNKMRCAGQTCVSPQRAFIHCSVYDQFVDKAVALANTASCGCLHDEEKGANTGPLISAQAVARMEAIVADAAAHHCPVLCGGSRPLEKQKGHYFLPTVIAAQTRELRAFREEAFGPILCVMPYDTDEEALDLANDTEYGLASYIWSNDFNQINRLSRGLQFGIVNVNGPGTGPSLPHGGCKDSGIGKDGSRYSLEEYTYIKGMRLAVK